MKLIAAGDGSSVQCRKPPFGKIELRWLPLILLVTSTASRNRGRVLELFLQCWTRAGAWEQLPAGWTWALLGTLILGWSAVLECPCWPILHVRNSYVFGNKPKIVFCIQTGDHVLVRRETIIDTRKFCQAHRFNTDHFTCSCEMSQSSSKRGIFKCSQRNFSAYIFSAWII